MRIMPQRETPRAAAGRPFTSPSQAPGEGGAVGVCRRRGRDVRLPAPLPSSRPGEVRTIAAVSCLATARHRKPRSEPAACPVLLTWGGNGGCGGGQAFHLVGEYLLSLDCFLQLIWRKAGWFSILRFVFY